MKDLDFDELDKAVNSLMSGVAKDAPAKSDTSDDPVIELKPQGDMSKAPESFSTPVSTPPNAQQQSQSSTPTSPVESKNDQQSSSSVPVVSDASTTDTNVTVVTPAVESPVRSTATSLISHESDNSNEDVNSETTPDTPTAQTGSEPSKNTPMTVPSSLPARRAGRFMDMVHPSADMKRPEVAAKPSRSGVTIAPRDSFSSSATAPTESSDPAIASEHTSDSSEDLLEQPVSPVAALTGIDANPVVKKAEETSVPVVSHESQSKSEWPDPLDMAGFEEDKLDRSLKNVTKSDKPANTSLFGSEPTDTLKPKKDEEISASAPLTSPFLPDTKVEKRPLGGGLSADEPDHTPVHPSSNDEQSYGKSDPEAQLPPSNDAADAPLPAELHSDLIAIEADKGPADQVAVQPESSSSSNSPSVSAIKRPEPSVPTQASSANTTKSTDTVSEKTVSTPTGPTSIPKQYREEHSTSDEDNGSIYDTDSYHQPLDHPPKKKSGWMWIVWILLILVAGAAGGAGIYFMGML